MPLQQHSASSQTGLAILLLIVIILAGGWFALKPAFGNYKTAKSNLSATESRLEEKKQAQQSIEKLIADYDSNQQKIEILQSTLPKDLETPQILAMLESLSLQNGLIVEAITISDEELTKLTQNQSIPTPVETQSNPGEVLHTASIGVDLTGSQESFRIWLSALEKNLRLFDIQLLSTSVGNGGDIAFKVQLSVYYQ